MKLDRRQQVLLAILAGVVLIALVLRGGGGGESAVGAAAPGVGRGGRAKAAADKPLITDVEALQVDRLDPRSGAFEVGRNPFSYASVAPPPPPPPVRPPVVAAPPPPPPVDTGPPVPTPPSPDYLKVLGTFGTRDSPIAAILSGEDILNVRKGDVIDGKFIVQDIGYESVTLGFVGFPQAAPTRVPLGG